MTVNLKVKFCETMSMKIKQEVGPAFYEMLEALLKSGVDSFGDKSWMQPENPIEIANYMDKDCKSLKISVVSFYTLLYNSHRFKVIAKRKKTLDENRGNRVGAKKLANASTAAGKDKTNRIDTIPQYFIECTSPAAKIALILFALVGYSESLKRKLIYAILNGSMDTMDISEVIELCQKNPEDVRKYLANAKLTDIADHLVKSLIKAFIEIAELLKEKSCSKLALEIGQNEYIEILKQYMDNYKIHSTCPCDAIIEKYLKDCVPSLQQKDERKKIYKEFVIDRYVISKLAAQLPQPKVSTNTTSSTNNKACLFNDDDQFQIYEGPLNYTKHIVTSFVKHGGKTHKIQTFNDSLYDVIGSESDELIDDLTGKPKTELYTRNSWRDRLNMIPYRTKVSIKDVSGKQLNEFTGSAAVTVSWMDQDGFNCMKTYSFQKRDRKPHSNTE